METVSIVLFLLLAVVLSGAISRMTPVSVPAPLVQIALGAAIGLSTSHRVALDPDLFLLLFLPPLLFLDGWRIPKDELFKDIAIVAELALGLVLFTVLGMGVLIHWMIPAMPLAVAFALAAVVSPTDPIAVSAIAARVPIPQRMMHILEGESLLNDASGLVCLRFAIAAALTGSFSAADAALNFLWVAGVGLLVGVGVTLAASRAKAWVSKRFGEEPGTQILVSLLIPFGSYLLAEHLDASGILAAVAAGIAMTYAEIARAAMATTRMRRNSVWDTIQFALNGIIFVLLGEQLPGILASAATTVRTTGHADPLWLGLYVLAIVAGLAALRFTWVWVSVRLTLLRRRRGESAPTHSPGWRLVAAMSLAGVRGAITLAGVLTIPFAMENGAPFPARDLAIFLAAGVIIVSLIVASIGLPMLLNGLTMPAEPSRRDEEEVARRTASEAAIAAIDQAGRAGEEADEMRATTADRIIEAYRARLEQRDHGGDMAQIRRQERVERDLQLIGLRAERASILAQLRAGQIGSETARGIVRELDLREVRYSD